MNHSPTDVSVILPVLNGSQFLSTAIESVLRQSLPPGELLVVDGGSTDGSRAIAASYSGVKLLSQSGTGLANAWNQGIRAATGTLIAFIESDDYWAVDKLERQCSCMNDRPHLDYVIGRVRFFLEAGHAVPPGFKAGLLEGDQIGRIPGTLMVRRGVFDHVGLFDESLSIAADVDWFARCKDAGVRWELLDHVFLNKRVHDENLSNNAGENTRQLLSVLRRSVERQREAGGGPSDLPTQ